MAAATHTRTRTFSIPDGRASAVKCLTRHTAEVTGGETARVQRDFGPRCEGARQQLQGAAGANEGCAFALYFAANSCACVAIQGFGGGGGNIFRFSIYIYREMEMETATELQTNCAGQDVGCEDKKYRFQLNFKE